MSEVGYRPQAMYWVSVRAYNPTLMRWLQPDPSQQDGLRTYVYVGDDPVDTSDPSGLAGVGVPGPGDLLADAITLVFAGMSTVVAIAATPEVLAVLAAAGIAVGATIAIGGVIYVVRQIQLAQPKTVTVPVSAPQPGSIQPSPIAGGTTLTTPSQVALPAYHSAANTGPIQLPMGGKIRGYTKHGLNQVISRNNGRGVDPAALLDAVSHPRRVRAQADGKTRYDGKEATVILNDKGQVVTAWGKPRSS